MPTALITGAARGIGLGFARSLALDGWHVHACCRHPEKADDLKQLGASVVIHRVDVTDGLRVASLARGLRDEALDLLINNAGIFGSDAGFGHYDYDDWLEVMAVNSIAPMRMIARFADQVAASKRKLIVNLSSVMGSIGETGTANRAPYRASKAALNMVTRLASVELATRGICVVAMHPGWVRTDMGGAEAPLSVGDSVRHMRQTIDRITLDDSGRFLAYDGSAIAW